VCPFALKENFRFFGLQLTITFSPSRQRCKITSRKHRYKNKMIFSMPEQDSTFRTGDCQPMLSRKTITTTRISVLRHHICSIWMRLVHSSGHVEWWKYQSRLTGWWCTPASQCCIWMFESHCRVWACYRFAVHTRLPGITDFT
jgi:hypothetical protein